MLLLAAPQRDEVPAGNDSSDTRGRPMRRLRVVDVVVVVVGDGGGSDSGSGSSTVAENGRIRGDRGKCTEVARKLITDMNIDLFAREIRRNYR